MKKIVIGSLLAIVLLLAGCAFNYDRGTVQHEEAAFLKLTGNLENAYLAIDDNAPVMIEESDTELVYQIKPGTHIITVTRNGAVVVKRELYFDDQVTREVAVK
jgi:hypothetical protein